MASRKTQRNHNHKKTFSDSYRKQLQILFYLETMHILSITMLDTSERSTTFRPKALSISLLTSQNTFLVKTFAAPSSMASRAVVIIGMAYVELKSEVNSL